MMEAPHETLHLVVQMSGDVKKKLPSKKRHGAPDSGTGIGASASGEPDGNSGKGEGKRHKHLAEGAEADPRAHELPNGACNK
jgi:hypothetical protein